MKNSAPLHPLRYIDERRDDDEPGAPWPWLEPVSGQARRAGGVILGNCESGNEAKP